MDVPHLMYPSGLLPCLDSENNAVLNISVSVSLCGRDHLYYAIRWRVSLGGFCSPGPRKRPGCV